MNAGPRIVDYDSAWLRIAETWLRRLRSALSVLDEHGKTQYEHVGSTAVVGLAAKPIIDLQLCVDTLPGEERLRASLAPLGFRLAAGARPESPGVRQDTPRPGTDPDRAKHAKMLFYRAATADEPALILHVRRIDSPFAAFVVDFRDWLRSDVEHARQYAAFKRHLAQQHGGDEEYDDYTRGKSAFMDLAQQQMQSHCCGLQRPDRPGLT